MSEDTTRTDDARGRPPDDPDPTPTAHATGVDIDGLTWSRRHRIGFRVYSTLAALVTLAFFSFGLVELFVMWLPDETLRSMNTEEYPGGLLVHRSHFMAIGIVAWTLVPAVLVQLRKPWRRVAPMQVLVVMVVAGLGAFALEGTLRAWLTEDVWFTAMILVLAALHPRVRDVFRRPAFDRDLLRWAAVGAVPWAAYALIQADRQLNPAPGDLHAGEEHWAIAFLMGVAIVTCGLVGASDHDGWRLPAWTAALASIVFGVHSLVFSGLASGLSTPWAVAAVGWGGVYGVLTVTRPRRAVDPAGAGGATDAGDAAAAVTTPA